MPKMPSWLVSGNNAATLDTCKHRYCLHHISYSQRNAKVCDFGTSKCVERDVTGCVGTVAYMAPELMSASFEDVRKCPLAIATHRSVCSHCHASK